MYDGGNHLELRKIILKALYSDDWLYNQLVLKGGNALAMIYGVGMRTSLDLDFSIRNDFSDLEEVSKRIQNVLTLSFIEYGIRVFDFNFYAKPKKASESWWGGYRAEFKLITEDSAETLDNDIGSLRRQSLVVDAGSQKRKYSIEISKFEYIEGAQVANYEGTDVFVYTPVLLAVEKLRALLQQHHRYSLISNEVKRSRGRDLYDIWALCDYFVIDLAAHFEVVKAVFEVKKVPMSLLSRLYDVKTLHQQSWADVELSVADKIEDYEFYFKYVNQAALKLYSQWEKYLP